jgi:hypothetical protein
MEFVEAQGLFRYDPDIPDQQLLKNIAIIRQDPRFAQYDDMQIEKMLMHHTPQEILQHGPDEALARYRDLSVQDDAFDGDFDF